MPVPLPPYNPDPDYPGVPTLHPADLESAYNFNNLQGGTGETVAVIEDDYDPTLEHDNTIFREQYGLPLCTSASGCLQQYDAYGTYGQLPPSDGQYSEMVMDVDAISAVCANCKILVLDVNMPDLYPLWPWVSAIGTAVNTAASLGANAVSISFNDSELDCPDAYSTTCLTEATTLLQQDFSHPGVAITASSGDLGFQGPPSFEPDLAGGMPADMPGVVSVGGSALTPDSSNTRGWDETVWGTLGGSFGSGGGCSLFIPAPNYQRTNYCPGGMRMYPDIVAYANPFDIYLTDSDFPAGAWTWGDGTSLSSPIIAAMYALEATPGTPLPQSVEMYADYYVDTPSPFIFDITTGTNVLVAGACASYPVELCNAGPGIDGPTGLGSPDGLGIFQHYANFH